MSVERATVALPEWARFVGWCCLAGSILFAVVSGAYGNAAIHSQPVLAMLGLGSLLVAHVWLLAASSWVAASLWRGRRVERRDALLIVGIASFVAVPYIVSAFLGTP